jgi:hypothetical protein
MFIELKTNHDNIFLTLIKDVEKEGYYQLVDDSQHPYMGLKLNELKFMVIEKDDAIISSEEEINAKLDQLLLDLIESEQSGTENTENNYVNEIDPYNPDDIKVSSKQFSIKLIKEMIDRDDLILNPNFQRHLVWDRRMRSRLIESILLRIPLPMFYFSEDNEGKLTVIDGLQRLTAINDFMDNKFPLRDLEYLRNSCEGKSYETLEPKYFRWFNLTQIFGNVIDPSSPYKVKYDIFKRINTGGKSLNNQEIRNCLSGEALRKILHKMVSLEEFKNATDNSINPVRMDDEEIALRFILFRLFKSDGDGIEEYNGYMDIWLDNLTDTYSKQGYSELTHYVTEFSTAMKNAAHLFGGKHAFRKIRLKDISPSAKKLLINKALFVSWSVLLADYDHERIIKHNDKNALLKPLAEEIQKNDKLRNYLSSGTNGKANMKSAFSDMEKIIQKHLKY